MIRNQSHRPHMERRKTMTMNWAGLRDDDEDEFFESCDRISSARPLDLDSDEEDEFYDPRLSFASTNSSISHRTLAPAPSSLGMMPDYNIWMAAPGSISERRKRLLQGMGLTGSKQVTSFKRMDSDHTLLPNGHAAPTSAPPPENVTRDQPKQATSSPTPMSEPTSSPSPSHFPMFLVRSRSLREIDTFSSDRLRKEALLGSTSKQRLTCPSTGFIFFSSYRDHLIKDGSKIGYGDRGDFFDSGGQSCNFVVGRLFAGVQRQGAGSGSAMATKVAFGD